MTHVVQAPELLRVVSTDDHRVVSIVCAFGLHDFEHEISLIDLARLVDPSRLVQADPLPHWAAASGGAMVPFFEEAKKARKPKFVTAGCYANSLDARAEYEELNALGKQPKATKGGGDPVAARRSEIVAEQAARHARLGGAVYATGHLGESMCMVLAQCLNRLAETGHIDRVWAAIYRNKGWLAALEREARDAGNHTLADTARRLRPLPPPPPRRKRKQPAPSLSHSLENPKFPAPQT